MTERKEIHLDLLIMGGGPAGMSAAIYAARGALKAAILDTSMVGGQVNNTLEIENYPGFGLIGGADLAEKFEAHIDSLNVEKYDLQEITSVDLGPEIKTVETLEYTFKAKTVIIATGAQPKKMAVPGEAEFAGRGVSYCAVCDGAFYRGKDVVVVGGGNAAVEEAVYLTRFAESVTLIHRRDELRADKVAQQRAFDNPKVKFLWNAVVNEVLGSSKVESITVKDVKTGQTNQIKTDGVFPYIGFSANSEQFATQLKLDKSGFIETDQSLETSMKGVFAAGDVRTTPLRQVIMAAADGALAATNAIRYLDEAKTHISV